MSTPSKKLVVYTERAPAVHGVALLPEGDQDRVRGLQLDMAWDEAIQGERAQHIFGAMMILLHDHLSNLSTLGQVAKGGKGAKGTGLQGWLEKYAPKVKRPTALRWMKATEGLISKAQLRGPEALQHLLDSDEEELSEADRAKQLELFGLIEGCSQNDLLTKEETKVKAAKAKRLTAAQAKQLMHTVTTNAAEHLRTLHKEKAFVVLNDKELDGLEDHLEETLKAVRAWKKMPKTQREEALAEHVALQLKPAKANAAAK